MISSAERKSHSVQMIVSGPALYILWWVSCWQVHLWQRPRAAQCRKEERVSSSSLTRNSTGLTDGDLLLLLETGTSRERVSVTATQSVWQSPLKFIRYWFTHPEQDQQVEQNQHVTAPYWDRVKVTHWLDESNTRWSCLGRVRMMLLPCRAFTNSLCFFRSESNRRS